MYKNVEKDKIFSYQKKLFSFIKEGQKLKIIKSNKNLQKNLNISIINYKFYSGRNIIYESNGIGKEYNGNDGKLIFEGEYLNGKRWNGKIKEYDYDGELIFEGEYLNGQWRRKRI